MNLWKNAADIVQGEIRIRVLRLQFAAPGVESKCKLFQTKKKKKAPVQCATSTPRGQLIVEVDVRLDRAGLGGGGVLGGRLGGGVDLGVGCFRALREE